MALFDCLGHSVNSAAVDREADATKSNLSKLFGRPLDLSPKFHSCLNRVRSAFGRGNIERFEAGYSST